MGENRQPTSVTDAQSAADEDYRRRIRRYTISMIIRVVCLLLAFVFSGPVRWILLGGAIVFPWVAVVIANSRDERLVQYDVATVTPRSPDALPRTARPQDRPGESRADDGSGEHEDLDDRDFGDVDDGIIPGEEVDDGRG
ncbi:DUF3099 domain-containing protein [Brevibacterium senegalense]|uniref:DUF3099 domain-containing protein n=1 Tax=Brevibacterium senegalense TaxID=1033736 RepID=UPI0002D7C591|nr:DUF3099 domain-containing protein [Brevibacterium senegalense]